MDFRNCASSFKSRKEAAMDNQDREFEAFLGQFALRQHRPFPEEAVVDPPRRYRWVLATAAVAVASLLSIPIVRQLIPGGVQSATVQIAGDSSYSAGEKIVPGEPIRSGVSESAVIRLKDGAGVELRAQSEAVLKSASNNRDIHLGVNNGSFLVTAAKQRTGHLYVETRDLALSAIDSVFLVEVEPSGTSVGVIEGIVEVRFGESVQKLSTGEQLSTDALRESRRLADSISWSRSSRRLTALLPFPPVITIDAPPAPKETARRRVSSPQSPKAETPPARERDELRQLLIQESVRQQSPPTPAPQPAPPAEPEQQPKSDAGANDPGKVVFNRACGLCHRLDAMENARNRSREDYQVLVSRQVSYG